MMALAKSRSYLRVDIEEIVEDPLGALPQPCANDVKY